MAKASHGISHGAASIGWSINQVWLKPSEWLVSRRAAPVTVRTLLPCGPQGETACVPRAHIAGPPPDTALHAGGAAVPGMALPARRLLYGARSPARALALHVPSLNPSGSPLARGFHAVRGAASYLAAADVIRARRWLAPRTVVMVSGFAASASSAACAGAETEGEGAAEEGAASGERDSAPSEPGDDDETTGEGREVEEEVRARTQHGSSTLRAVRSAC